jgi:hypothetical protein
MALINSSGYTPRQLHQIEQRRIKKLVNEFTVKGYFCLANAQFFSGVDILVFNQNWRLCIVIESTNYSYTSKMHPNTARRYLRQFAFFNNVDKLLVISYDHNISKTQQQNFRNNGIHIRVEGKQD